MVRFIMTLLSCVGAFFLVGGFIPTSHHTAFSLATFQVSYLMMVIALVFCLGTGWIAVRD